VTGVSALEHEQVLKIGLCCENVSRMEQAVNRLFSDPLHYKWHYSFVIGIEVFSPQARQGRGDENDYRGPAGEAGLRRRSRRQSQRPLDVSIRGVYLCAGNIL
jgi:hypothetical protein